MKGVTNQPNTIVLSHAMQTALERLADGGSTGIARRARIILARARGLSLTPIALSVGLHRDSVRRWIARFRARGLEGLQHGNAGKPKNVVFDAAVCAEILRRAKMHPRTLGEPFDAWSLYKLRDHLVRTGVVRSICVERVRQLLNAGSYSRQHWLDTKRSLRVEQPPQSERDWLRELQRSAVNGLTPTTELAASPRLRIVR